MRRLLLLTTWVLACQPSPEPAADVADAAASPAVAAPLAVDDRDQYALLADIEATVGNALARDGGAMTALRQKWHGKRYRWEVATVPMLCRTAGSCHAAPFDHARFPDRRIQQGWMPQLELDDAGFAALGRLCAGKKVCVVQLEGTMRDLVFDPELATAVRFADIRLLGARDGMPHESWMSSRTPIRRRA